MSSGTVSLPRRRTRALPRPLGLDPLELGALVALSLLSLVVLAGLLTKGRPLSGADGLLAADQLQYFAWIRDASQHVLIGNRFDLAPGPRTFLHPGFLISGLLHDIGLSIPLSYLFWKPVAIGVMFFGARAYVRRMLEPGRRRAVALILALFTVAPASALVAFTGWGGKPRQYTFDFMAGELFPGNYLWGYLMTAIAVFLMPFVLLGVERWRKERRPRTLVLAALGTLIVCWLQPWQGATLGLIVVAVEVWRWLRTRERPPLALLLVPAGAAIPALYYFLLARYDAAWKLAGKANAAGAQSSWSWPWWAVLLTLAPLAVPALLTLRRPARDWQEMAIRIWPFAGIIVYFLPLGTFPYHAFQGLSIPLAILAVQGVLMVRPHPRPWVVAAAVFVMTVPGIAHRIDVAKGSVHAGGDPFFVFPGEVQALKALEADPRPGGVLAPTYSGYMVPYRTGRETYVGAISWSPDWVVRQRLANSLFEGRLTGPAARRFVLSTHARFLFADCRSGLVDLTRTLRPLLQSTQRYGCATVWVLRPRPGMAAVGASDE